MTSRARVLTACNRREPDRVPIDFSGHPSSGIAAIAYARLRDYLGLPKKTIRVYDPSQQLAIVVDDDLMAKFAVDTIDMTRGFALTEESWSDCWVTCKTAHWYFQGRRLTGPAGDGQRRAPPEAQIVSS